MGTDTRLELEVSDTAPEPSRSVGGLSPPIAAFISVALAALLFWWFIGRRQWFHHDEWDFVAARKAGDLGDLFRPHGPHWVTLPVLLYRAIFGVFGLRTYVPYRIPVLASHLVVAALLLVIMRRAEVRPWIAVAAASLFVAFGAGVEDIINPFQVTFTAALAFGLAHLLLADHAGPVNRRDGYGLLAGLFALMCSGVGVCMVAVVGLAVLFRRGWRIAALHTLPLGVIYVVWLAIIGRKTSGSQRSHPTIGTVVRFVATGEREAYDWIAGGFKPFGLAVALLIAGGLTCAVIAHHRSRTLSRIAAPVALMVGSAVFLAITASGRLFLGIAAARTSRYVYLIAAMTIPALAVAVDALAARWRWFLPVAIGVFLIGVPANVRHSVRYSPNGSSPTREIFTSLQQNSLSRHVPPSIRPEPVLSPEVTIGWLVAESPPRSTGISSQLRFEDNFRLAFAQSKGAAPTQSCYSLWKPHVTALAAGDLLGLYYNTVVVSPAPATEPHLLGPPLVFFPRDGRRIAVVESPGRVRFELSRHPLNWAMHRYDTRRVPRICIQRATPSAAAAAKG